MLKKLCPLLMLLLFSMLTVANAQEAHPKSDFRPVLTRNGITYQVDLNSVISTGKILSFDMLAEDPAIDQMILAAVSVNPADKTTRNEYLYVFQSSTQKIQHSENTPSAWEKIPLHSPVDKAMQYIFEHHPKFQTAQNKSAASPSKPNPPEKK